MGSDKLLWTEQLEELFGIPPGGFEGTYEGWRRRVYPEDLPRLEAMFAQWAAEHSAGGTYEYRHVMPSGEVRWIEGATYVEYDEAGHTRRMLGTNVDITERKRSEEHLRQSAERLSLALSLARAGYWECQREPSDAYWSPELFTLFGLPPDDSAAQANWLERVHPEDRALCELDRLFEQVPHQGQVQFEYRYEHPRLGQRWILAKVSAQFEEPMRPVRLMGFCYDITERKQDELALKQTAESLSLALQTAQAGSWEWEIQTETLRWSPEFYDLFGIDRALPATYHRWLDALVPEDHDKVQQFIEDILARGEEKLLVVFRIQHPKRGLRWISGIGRIIYRDGRPLRMSGISLDITEQREREQALIASEERFRMAAQAVEGIVYDCDLRADRVYRSEGLFKLVGWHPNEVPEYGDWWVQLIHPTDRPRVLKQLAEAPLVAPRLQRYEYEYRVRHRAGHWVYLWDRGYVVLGDDGRPVRIVGSSTDITARKQHEQMLRELNEQLERRVAERTADVRRRAMQLRSLASQLSQTEQQERRRLADALHNNLQQILVSANMQLAKLRRNAHDVQELHTVEQIESMIREAIAETRSLTLQISPPVLRHSDLAGALGWLAIRMQEQYDLEVAVDLEQCPEPADEAIKHFIFESARELLFNVVKHAGVLHATLHARSLPGPVLQLVIEDDGRGCPDHLPGDAGGKGFGLFSITERTQFYGGTFNFTHSALGGCRAELRLPLDSRAPELHVDEALAAPTTSKEPSAAETIANEPIRLVIVDDHQIVREGIVRRLEEELDFRIIGEGADGAEALKLAQVLQPDVLVIDVNMPQVNGIQATRRIRRAHPQVQVIGLSVNNDESTARAMLQAGAAAYVLKDAPAEQLVQAIRRHARRNTTPAGQALQPDPLDTDENDDQPSS